MSNPFIWDHNSDQPYPIKDKKYKKSMYRKALGDTIKTFATSLVLAPLIAYKYFTQKSIQKPIDAIFGMGVNLDKLPHQSPALIEELGVKNLFIRLPLSDMANIEKYLAFVQSFKDCHITLNILQDRAHIQNLEQTKHNAQKIFELFSPFVVALQVGNAINRKKWGFASMDEYMRFYKIFASVQKDYPKVALIGSSVIDFEYHYTIRTLFNGYNVVYDKIAALLYVDRRGAPENTQLGFDFLHKIKLLYAMVGLSKSQNKIIISELNWPISNTAPYAPTSEYECVDEQSYANFLVRSHLLAVSSGMVETIFWHQLVASGYGLIDVREGIRKRDAFYAYKFMVQMLQNAKLLEHHFDTIYSMKFQKNHKVIEVFWAKEPTDTTIEGRLYDQLGNEMQKATIGESVIYKESK